MTPRPDLAGGLDYLASLSNLETGAWPSAPSLDRMSTLASALGSPQHAFPAVHVTGTNGKGSTATLTAALLSACGHRVGLYTSPHRTRVNERIVVLDRALERVRSTAVEAGVRPTWFEAIMLVCFLVFAEAFGVRSVIERQPARALDFARVVAGRSGSVIATGSMYLVEPFRSAARQVRNALPDSAPV